MFRRLLGLEKPETREKLEKHPPNCTCVDCCNQRNARKKPSYIIKAIFISIIVIGLIVAVAYVVYKASGGLFSLCLYHLLPDWGVVNGIETFR